MDPEGEMDHQSDGKKAAIEEEENFGKLKEDEMERGAIHFCDNRCSEKAVRCWQFASVVVEDGGEARTVNLCQQCCNERRVQQGEPRMNSWQWRAVVEKKAHRGRIWRIMGNEQFTRGMWEYLTLKRAEAKRIRDDAAREKQEGHLDM